MDDNTLQKIAFENIPIGRDPFTGREMEDPVVFHRDLSDWWPQELNDIRDDRLANIMITERSTREAYYKKLKSSGVVIALSGGLDSTTLLYWALQLFNSVHCVSFDYGQRHKLELDYAEQSVKRLLDMGHTVSYESVDMSPINKLAISALTRDDINVPRNVPIEEMGLRIPKTFVPGRNVYFTTALSQVAYQLGWRHIGLGVNVLDYSGYPDCRPEFIVAMRQALSIGIFNGQDLNIHAPLMQLNKKNIIRLGLHLGVDYSNTHSCYNGVVGGCGECDSCILREAAFKDLGTVDPGIAKRK